MQNRVTAFPASGDWKRYLAAWCVYSTAVLGAGAAEPGADWRPAKWVGEKAWEASSAGWTAVVSEGRGRLVSLAPAGSRENLLFASPRDSPFWGGHRCWLGPQPEWKGGSWPPPKDWETSAAEEGKAEGPTLTLTLPHTDPAYPPLTRRYEWRAGILHCRLSWQGGEYHAIQIVQLPSWATIHLRLGAQPARADVPLGYARLPIAGRETMQFGQPMAEGVGSVKGKKITLWHANTTEKLGFAAQELRAEVGAFQLKVRRGEDTGVSAELPNAGMVTQVYLGDWLNPFVELEQLSAFGGDGPSSSEILLEPARLSRP